MVAASNLLARARNPDSRQPNPHKYHPRCRFPTYHQVHPCVVDQHMQAGQAQLVEVIDKTPAAHKDAVCLNSMPPSAQACLGTPGRHALQQEVNALGLPQYH
jgi:hypothetical protein